MKLMLWQIVESQFSWTQSGAASRQTSPISPLFLLPHHKWPLWFSFSPLAAAVVIYCTLIGSRTLSPAVRFGTQSPIWRLQPFAVSADQQVVALITRRAGGEVELRGHNDMKENVELRPKAFKLKLLLKRHRTQELICWYVMFTRWFPVLQKYPPKC